MGAEKYMLDYRNNSYESPMAWCAKHQKLIPVDQNTRVMSTAYQVTEWGIFPYAVCEGACSTQRDSVEVESLDCAEQIAIG